MSKLAVIFPGQGSQYVGMGKDLYERNPIVREFFDKADTILGFSLSKICFEGPEEELRQTKNTQPAIFLHSIVLMHLLENISAEMTAGHSLGEYSACVFAGALTFEDGLKIVRLRGELMQKAGDENPGTMAAVIGLSPEIVGEVCCTAWKEGVVQAANYNSPGQIVISGSVAGVHKAMELAKARGAKMVRELVVSGAFHSPLMQSARDGLRNALEGLPITDARIPIYTNVSAHPVQKTEEIRESLEQQLTNPVRWKESVQRMIADGVTKFIEVGPGKVLQGLVRRFNATVEVTGVDTFGDIEKLVPSISGM